MRFIDTNILLYAISRDPAEQDKAKRANDVLAERDLALSVQVLQEFYVQATRASRPDAIGHRQAVLLIESFRRFPVQDITTGIMMAALDTRQRFQLSYWDAAIIEASRAMGCTQVLSEDLGDGQDYGGVRVANPFRWLYQEISWSASAARPRRSNKVTAISAATKTTTIAISKASWGVGTVPVPLSTTRIFLITATRPTMMNGSATR